MVSNKNFRFSGSLGNEAVIVTKDDDVYALGFNGSGCLGVGDQNSTMEPRKIEPLCQKKVKGKCIWGSLNIIGALLVFKGTPF